MRIAIIHYWLLGMRGGEKVLESLCRIFPAADIFTLFYDPAAVSPLIRSRTVHASWLNPLRRVHRSLLPLMPMALEDFDLRSYDLILSSESGPAKGVLAPAKSRHFCYCHTPMRYLWELYPAYRHDFGSGLLTKAMMAPLAHWLRVWDYSSAARVDGFMANGRNTKHRIWKTYRRQSRIVYPPVAVGTFQNKEPEGYSLLVAEMVAYKQLDYAIRTFARAGRRLKVVGGGPEYRNLKKQASAGIEFCGRATDVELRELYARADTLIVPGEEDFGITMVEALASGKPVIALARGGALEIVSPGCGVLYNDATEDGLGGALRAFDWERRSFDPAALMRHAARFSEAMFERRFLRTLARFWGMNRAEELAGQIAQPLQPWFLRAMPVEPRRAAASAAWNSLF